MLYSFELQQTHLLAGLLPATSWSEVTPAYGTALCCFVLKERATDDKRLFGVLTLSLFSLLA